MPVDCGHLRTMRLLPFTAAAVDLLTFGLQPSRMAVHGGHSRRSRAYDGRLGSARSEGVGGLLLGGRYGVGPVRLPGGAVWPPPARYDQH